MSRLSLGLLVTVLAFASFSYGQELPGSIRGYKVHRTKVQFQNAAEKKANNKNPTVTVGDPRIVSLDLSGVTLEADAKITGLDQNGQVDSLMFKDVVVNGIPLAIDDYEHPFQFRKGSPASLPMPVRGRVSAADAMKAAYKEATSSRDMWHVSGTVFVFGRFKKMRFSFKRVIPVPISLTISNPLKNLASSSGSR